MGGNFNSITKKNDYFNGWKFQLHYYDWRQDTMLCTMIDHVCSGILNTMHFNTSM